MSIPKLWEIKHSYYASDANYFSNDYTTHYGDWAEFINSEGRDDADLNCLFRWDWRRPNPSDYEDDPEGAPPDCVQLTFILQRKGIYRAVFVGVTEADEPAVREYLAGKARYIADLWSPFLDESKVTP